MNHLDMRLYVKESIHIDLEGDINAVISRLVESKRQYENSQYLDISIEPYYNYGSPSVNVMLSYYRLRSENELKEYDKLEQDKKESIKKIELEALKNLKKKYPGEF